MKRASIYERMTSAGADARRPSSQQDDRASRRSGLGPRGQGLFERLFGTSRTNSQPTADARSEAPVFAIASGKGGTGKSFVSTSLAVALHRAGHRTTLVDCDFGLACDHLLLGVKPGTHLQHVVQGRLPVTDVRIETAHGPGLVPGVTGVRQMTQLQDHEMRQFGEALGQLAAVDDCVLLDTGAGLSPQTVLTLCAADHVILVTQPEIAALTDAYAVLKTLSQVGTEVSLSVIVNRVTEDGRRHPVDSIIWATGFQPDLPPVDPVILDESGRPRQVQGVTPVPGVYVLGLRWMHRLDSGLFHGVSTDALHVTERIASQLHTGRARG